MLRRLIVVALVLAGCGKSEPKIEGHTVALTQGASVDAAFDTEVREAIATQLAEAGFLVVADPAQAAMSLVLDLKSEKVRPGLSADTSLFRVTGTLHAKAPSASEDLALAWVREARRNVEVALWAKRLLISELGKRAVVWLAMQPEIPAEIERLSKRKEPEQLVFTRPRAEAWLGHVKGYEDHCKAERERLAAQDKTLGMTCLGDPCANWTPAGVSPDGKTAFVQADRRDPIFEMKVARDLSWIEPPEIILRVPLDGAPPTTLFESANLYAYSEATGDGKVLTVSSFDADGKLAFARIDTTSGAFVGKPFVLDGDRANFAYPLADGLLVGVDPLLVVGPDGRRPIENIETSWFLHDGFASKTSDGRLVRFDAHGKELGSVDFDTKVVSVAAAGPNLYVVERSERECSLLKIGASMTLDAALSLEVCVDDIAVLGDGRVVGFSDDVSRADDLSTGDEELVLIAPTTGRVEALTRDADDEETLYVAGQRVLFSRRLPNAPPEYDVRLYRRQICFLDVAAQ